jgi:hypothetical protein
MKNHESSKIIPFQNFKGFTLWTYNFTTKRKSHIQSILTLVVFVLGSLVIIGLFIWLVFLIKFDSNNKVGYVGVISSLVTGLFGFSIQAVLILRSTSAVKQERTEKTYRAYQHFSVQYFRANSTLFSCLEKAFKEGSMRLVRIHTDSLYQIQIYYKNNDSVESLPSNSFAPFVTYALSLKDLCGDDPFWKEEKRRIYPNSAKDKDGSNDDDVDEALRIFSGVINETVASYLSGVFEDQLYTALLAKFVNLSCIYLFPYLVMTQKIVDYPYLSYNMCAMEEEYYELVQK